jgi:curved DNA-binding protein CbpA
VEFNYYQILGVSRNASEDEIKSAYKSLAKKYHPDRNAGNKIFEEHFKKINAAYQTLSDIEKRRKYDYKLSYISESVQQKRRAKTKTNTSSPAPNNTSKRERSTNLTDKKIRKYTFITVSALILFITTSIFFYHYMNNVSAKHHLEQAKACISKKSYILAHEEFTKAIEFNNDLYEAYEGRADVLYRSFRNYTQAEQDYSKALKGIIGDPDLYFKRAKCRLKLKEYDKGEEDITTAIAMQPGNDSLFFYRAEINHFIRQNFNKAIPDYSTIISRNKNFKDAWLGRALCFHNIGEYEKAVNDFNKVIHIEPGEGSHFYYRAFSKINLKDSSGACNDWIEAERLNFLQAREMVNKYCVGNKGKKKLEPGK